MRNKNFKIRLQIFLILLIFCFSFNLISCESKKESIVYITKVIDGDTFVDDHKIKYRLLGVDTPESFNAQKHFQPTTGIQKYFATKAAQLSSKTILKKQVSIDQWKFDKYHRLVAKIECEKICLANLLLSKGLARVKYISPIKGDYFYYYDTNYYYQILEIEKYAKVNKIGIWHLSIYDQNQVFPK